MFPSRLCRVRPSQDDSADARWHALCEHQLELLHSKVDSICRKDNDIHDQIDKVTKLLEDMADRQKDMEERQHAQLIEMEAVKIGLHDIHEELKMYTMPNASS